MQLSFQCSFKFFGFFWKLLHTSSSGITKSTETLIDKIFGNFSESSQQNISANLTTSFLDHLPEAPFVPGFYPHKNLPKLNVFIHDWKALIALHFLLIINLHIGQISYKLIKGVFTTTSKKWKRLYQVMQTI